MKISVDLNFDINDLDGVKVSTASKMVAGLLMSEMKGDAVKYFDWAVSFNSNNHVELDGSDLQTLKDLIKTTDRIAVMVKAPIIKYLNTLK